MKHTFKCDEGMLINIPLGALKDGQEGELMPDQFHCVFRDVYKVFITKGKPKRVGVAQAIVGLFVLSLALLNEHMSWQLPDQQLPGHQSHVTILTFLNILFVVSGMLTFAAGYSPNMCVAKLSFICHIISFLWCLVATVLYIFLFPRQYKVMNGINGLIVSFMGVEMGLTLFLIYWFSQCPVIRLQV